MEAANSMLRYGVRVKGEQKRRTVGKQSREWGGGSEEWKAEAMEEIQRALRE